jgi:hypothetical protein
MSNKYSKHWYEDMPNRVSGIKQVTVYPLISHNKVSIDVVIEDGFEKSRVIQAILNEIEYESGLLFSIEINVINEINKEGYQPVTITM